MQPINFRMFVRLAPLALLAFVAILPRFSYAVDFDGNGIEDSLEGIWAERYKPSFFVGETNPLTPEPVEILDRNANGIIDVDDLSGSFCRDTICDCSLEIDFCSGEPPLYELTIPLALHSNPDARFTPYLDSHLSKITS